MGVKKINKLKRRIKELESQVRPTDKDFEQAKRTCDAAAETDPRIRAARMMRYPCFGTGKCPDGGPCVDEDDCRDEKERGEHPADTVHMCPPGDSAIMSCCGKTPFEVPKTDRMTSDPTKVTCGK